MLDTISLDPTISAEPAGGPANRPLGGNALQWSNSRWYNPIAQRWQNPDPSGLGPDANPYRYCENDPTNETDPSGLEGHHWVPQAVVSDNSSILTGAAADVFAQETSGALAYFHGNDKWLNTSHLKYNSAVEQLLQDYAKSVPGGKLNEAQAQKFVGWISGSSTDGLEKFLPGNEGAIEAITNWRKGFEEAAIVAEAADEAAKKAGIALTKDNLKAIAKYAVNGEVTEGLTESAKLIYNTVRGGKAVLGAVAKKVIPGLIFLQFAAAAKNGFSQGVPTGQTGLVGAGMAMMRESVCADLVEGIAFPAIGKVMDAAENAVAPGGIDAARERAAQRNLHGVVLPPSPSPPAAAEVYDGSDVDQFGNLRRYFHDDSGGWYEDDGGNIGRFDENSAVVNIYDEDD